MSGKDDFTTTYYEMKGNTAGRGSTSKTIPYNGKMTNIL